MNRLLLLLVLILPSLELAAQEEPSSPSINAMVSLRVNGLDDVQWQKVSTRLSKEANVNVEYSCVTTGIIVLRMRNTNATERSDVMALVRRWFQEAGVKGRIDFLDIHVEPSAGNRCAVPSALSRWRA